MKKHNFKHLISFWLRCRVVLALMLIFLLGVSSTLTAQDGRIKVSGVVIDQNEEPLIGASVRVKGTTTGMLTNLDGKFVLEVPSAKSVLQISFSGLVTQEVTVGNQTFFNIKLKEDNKVLETVVVTALGLERKSKSLTYATQSVSGKELTRAKDANFINALQGKSAGLSITPNASGAGGGASKIILRGQSSILGNNQPLIVLDGIPLSGGMGAQATGNIVMGGARDGGDLLSTINPDDIASMTILKGANAAALYGSQANNGVLIINTKSGREGKLRVDVSSNTMFETPIMLPNIQNQYTGTIRGHFMDLDGWGKPISQITQEDMARLPYLTNRPVDNLRSFFNTGMSFNNSISINGGTQNYNSYFSYGNTSAMGLMPNNKFSRHNLFFKNGFKFLDQKLSLELTLNYIRQEVKNKPVVGKALSPLLALYRTPRSVDMRYFKNNYKHVATADDPFVRAKEGNRKLEGHEIQSWPWFDQYLNNPYWLLNKTMSNDVKNRVLANLTLKYQITDDLLAQTRLSIDQNMDRSQAHDYATLNIDSRLKGGRYWSGRYYNSDVFSDYLLTYNKEINENIEFNATAGTSFKRMYHLNYHSINYIDTAALPNVFVPDNNRLNDIQSSLGTVERWGTNWEAATFATVQFGLWQTAYLDASYRTDWSKAFQQFADDGKYKSFSYYSAGANVLLNKVFDLGEKINEMKLRVSFSEVGNSIPNSLYAARWVNFNSGAYSPPNAKFDNPLPETTRSLEVGLDGAMFDNRLNFDITVYQSIMSNQFLNITTSSGQSKPINSGKVRNRGIELTGSYNWDINKEWSWRPGVNFAYNDNLILTTYTDASGTSIPMEIGPKEFHIKYVAGRPYGDLYANSFVRDADGKIVIDETGTPRMETGLYKTFIGNTTARFTFGFNNTINYKNFNLYFLLDGKIGGKVISITESDLDTKGLSVRTAKARENGYLKTYTTKEGKEVTDLFFRLENGQEVSVQKYYKTVGANPNELYAYDATNVRFREISLGYTFYNLIGVSKNLSVSVVARNLGFLYKNSPVDPDISLSAANGFGGIDVYSLPTTRNIGINLKVTF